VSDQDFFFDEDEQPKAKPAKASTKSEGKPSAPRSKAPAPTAAQTVSLTVAGLIAVCTLLLGVIIGIALPSGDTATTAAPTESQVIAAPSLSPDQLETGELPSGHPEIGGMTEQAPVDGTESAETTEATE